jgi:hypothetical protein
MAIPGYRRSTIFRILAAGGVTMGQVFKFSPIGEDRGSDRRSTWRRAQPLRRWAPGGTAVSTWSAQKAS